MKLFKKLAAALVATMLVMTMIGGGAISAFAEGTNGSGTTYKVTIERNNQDKGTHTYEAYQIFAGDLSTSGSTKVLSNLKWGDGISTAGQAALAGSGTADDYAKTLTDANIEAQAKEIAKYLVEGNAHVGTATEIANLPAGYYLIQDKADSPSGTPSSKTKFIIAVVGDTKVKVKSSVPSVEKKVQDINDTSGTTLTNLQDSADYDIGDAVPYTITATIGDGIANYSAYSFQFVDAMTAGLTLDQNSWDIKASGTSVKDLFELTSKAGTSGTTEWTWATKNLKSGTTISDGMKIVLTYKAVLNENAVIGAKGNPNEVKLNFDNNPNACGEGKPSGTTPWDKNIVFTYKTVFNKVRPSGTSGSAPLTGADFKLEKKVNGKWVDVTELNSGTKNPKKSGTSAGSVFEFIGLDDGDYKLTETKTPTGYNSIDPIEFTITAEHEIESADSKLTSLTGTGDKGFTMTLMSDSGTLSADVVNESGATLPSTGGIGTTIFYVLGAILVLGGGVLLVTRRRMAA